MKYFGKVLAAAILAASFARPALSNSFTTFDVARGAYTSTLNNNQSGAAEAQGNYFAGFSVVSARDFIAFDLSGVTGTISSAALTFDTTDSPFSSFGSPVYTLYDYSGSIAELVTGTADPSATFADLGSGLSYGSVAVPAANGSFSISLNAAGLAALTASEGQGIAFGGRVSDEADSGVFPASGGDPLIRLTVTTVANGAVPEPASWAMFIGGFGMIGGAMRRRLPARARPA